MPYPIQRAAALLAAAALLLSACGTGSPPAPSPAPAPETSIAEPAPAPDQPAPEDRSAPEEAPAPEALGIGTAVFLDPGELTPGQQELILALVTRLYGSLAVLEVQDPEDLFAPEAEGQLWGNKAVWAYSCGVRLMQPADLSLTGWRAELTFQEMEEEEDGSIHVQVTEDSVQNFRAAPGVDSRQLGVRRHFYLRPAEGEDRWLLTAHSQRDTLYWMVMGRYAWGSSGYGSGAPGHYYGVLDRLLNTAWEDTQARLTQGEGREAAARNPYDRQGAVDYARRWVGTRSGDWPDYSRNGGNCQNFVSQCLLAGGVPMDTQGPAVWKWYGGTPDNLPRMTGRSASWSSVRDFLDYAQENSGCGLAASVDVPYYSGSPGDVIHLGTGDRWRHTVLISQVLAGEDGEPVDYLICSNTADLLDFPVGAYCYTRQMLIRIDGWNP